MPVPIFLILGLENIFQFVDNMFSPHLVQLNKVPVWCSSTLSVKLFWGFNSTSSFLSEAKAVLETCLTKQFHMMNKSEKITNTLLLHCPLAILFLTPQTPSRILA